MLERKNLQWHRHSFFTYFMSIILLSKGQSWPLYRHLESIEEVMWHFSYDKCQSKSMHRNTYLYVSILVRDKYSLDSCDDFGP